MKGNTNPQVNRKAFAGAVIEGHGIKKMRDFLRAMVNNNYSFNGLSQNDLFVSYYQEMAIKLPKIEIEIDCFFDPQGLKGCTNLCKASYALAKYAENPGVFDDEGFLINGLEPPRSHPFLPDHLFVSSFYSVDPIWFPEYESGIAKNDLANMPFCNLSLVKVDKSIVNLLVRSVIDLSPELQGVITQSLAGNCLIFATDGKSGIGTRSTKSMMLLASLLLSKGFKPSILSLHGEKWGWQ